MDNLSGPNWSPANKAPPKPHSAAPVNSFANLSLKPSSLSSHTVPAGVSAPRNAAAPKKAGDSFSSLVSFGRDKQSSNLSLLEQQQKLEEQRRRDAEESRRKMDAMFGGANKFWDTLDGRESASGVRGSPVPAPTPVNNNDDDDDILAAFNSSAPVNKSSYFPPPSSGFSSRDGNSRSGNELLGLAPSKMSAPSADPFDPFDVANLPSRDVSPFPKQSTPQTQNDDDFDILGDLAKPVSELPPRPPPQPAPSPIPKPREPEPEPSPSLDPRDAAIAEIMDMGFSAEQASRALEHTETGLDIGAAVGWLLEQAHKKSRPAASSSTSRHGTESWSRQVPSRDNRSREDHSRDDPSRSRRERDREDASIPAWARGGKTTGEKDIGALAAEVGGTLFKSANTLWSTGRKKVERAVAELKVDLADGGGDPNQPKWMRERQIREQLERRDATGISRHDRPPTEREELPRSRRTQPEPQITDEAMMLEIGSGPPPPPPRRKYKEERATPSPAFSRDSELSEKEQLQRQRMHEMEMAIREKEREMREREMRERSRASPVVPDSAARKAKLAAESEPVYVSRNRRRPPPSIPSGSSSKPLTPEPDFLGGGGSGSRAGSSSLNPFARDIEAERQRSPQPTPAVFPQPRRSPAATPPPRRPPPQKRPAVSISPSALTQSNAARQKGTEAFKRGDYTAAQAFYTSALSPIPEPHPLRIIVLANRCLSTIKLGDPKSALIDIDAMLALIGESRGESETILLDGVEKDMKEYWTKAITRKAECLEQLEKWSEAKTAWELALTVGGNAAAINGKRRCEAALKPKAPPKPKALTSPPKRAPPVSAKPSGAVTALRQANADQERQEAEKLELYDVVHERIGNWKNGKEGNLRALLAGLDMVLWEGSGWKKVGMGELLVPQKCKIAYMKGIAKVHPDKIGQDATTEQRMISAAVFSLLNDSWDKFKAENGL